MTTTTTTITLPCGHAVSSYSAQAATCCPVCHESHPPMRVASRMHTSVHPLAGTDDRIAHAAIDRAVGSYGGIWAEYRLGDGVSLWDTHGDYNILPEHLRLALRGAALQAAYGGAR